MGKQIPARGLLFYSPEAKNAVYILNSLGRGGSEEEPYFCDTWKLFEIQISVSTNQVLLEHGHAHSFRYGLGLLQSTTKAALSRLPRDYVDHKGKNTHWVALYR